MEFSSKTYGDLVTSDATVLNGRWVVAGSKRAVKVIEDRIERGETPEDILATEPYVHIILARRAAGRTGGCTPVVVNP
jgi:uncharacterized protein (DUF433 family)